MAALLASSRRRYAVIAPFTLKPFGIYLISLWAALTVAAIGLNLTLGYAGQISLANLAALLATSHALR